MNALEELQRCGGYLTDTHVVYSSWRHGSVYLNKDAIYPHPKIVSGLCRQLAESVHTAGDGAHVIIGPEKGGIILAQWTAFHLSNMLGTEVLAVYAEKEGDEFAFRRGQDAHIRGKTAMIVEDVLTTGGSVIKVINAARSLDCVVSGVLALFNRGDVGIDTFGPGIHRMVALGTVKLDSYPEDDCPLCRDGVPVNTTVGKGRVFLARRTASSS